MYNYLSLSSLNDFKMCQLRIIFLSNSVKQRVCDKQRDNTQSTNPGSSFISWKYCLEYSLLLRGGYIFFLQDYVEYVNILIKANHVSCMLIRGVFGLMRSAYNHMLVMKLYYITYLKLFSKEVMCPQDYLQTFGALYFHLKPIGLL